MKIKDAKAGLFAFKLEKIKVMKSELSEVQKYEMKLKSEISEQYEEMCKLLEINYKDHLDCQVEDAALRYIGKISLPMHHLVSTEALSQESGEG